MFVGRQNELKQLNLAYDTGEFAFAAICGRRHIGKTALISQFVTGKDAVCFSARELTDKYNLDAFTQKLSRRFGIDTEKLHTWEEAFDAVGNYSLDNRLILVIDNYTDICLTNKEISNLIADKIGNQFKNSKLFLILCCSHMAAFDREVTGKGSVLREHITLSMHVKGLPYEDACAFMKGYSPRDRKKLYGCIGGTPLYLSQINCNKTADQNIEDLFFNRSGFIYHDMSTVLQKELNGPVVYNALLRAIAHGKQISKEILAETGEENAKAHKYLNVLISLGVLCRVVPEGEDPLISRKGTYHFEDNAYRFWYRYVFDQYGSMEAGPDIVECEEWKNVSN